jgi:hypothetical protein
MKGGSGRATGPSGPLGRNASKVSEAPHDPPEGGSVGTRQTSLTPAGDSLGGTVGQSRALPATASKKVPRGAPKRRRPAAGVDGPSPRAQPDRPREFLSPDSGDYRLFGGALEPARRPPWRWDPARERWMFDPDDFSKSQPGAGDIATPEPSDPQRITLDAVSSRAAGEACWWCGRPMRGRAPTSRYCSQRCRQSAWRLRRRRAIDALEALPRRVAYADPPFPGMAHYYRDEPSYSGEVDHAALLSRLKHYDGWALSTSPGALRDVLALCPPGVHVCPWVKPYGVPRATRGLHTAWEPLIVKPARNLRPGLRDWLRAMPARGNGHLLGRKPIAFCAWLFDALGAVPGLDTLDDLFPGSGIVGQAWEALARERTSDDASGAQMWLPDIPSGPSMGDGPSPLEVCDAPSVTTSCAGRANP